MQITRYKLRGVMLITTVVAVAAWILLAGGIFLTQSSQFQMLGARKIEEQARQYAEVDAQILKYVAYDKLTDANTLKGYKLHLKRAKMETVEAADWEDEITISNEQKSSDKSGGYRVATINIYRKGDTKPRWSMDAILVKGAKNSSGSSTGDDPSKDDGDYEFTIVSVPYVYFSCVMDARYGISNLRGFVLYIYDNTGKHTDRLYPYMSKIPLTGKPYDLLHPFLFYDGVYPLYGSNVEIMSDMNEFNDWWELYNPYIKNNIAKGIERDSTYKTITLHSNGDANTNMIFSTKYNYIQFDPSGYDKSGLYKIPFDFIYSSDHQDKFGYPTPIVSGINVPKLIIFN